MALSQSAVSELLEAFRTGEGVDLIRESVRMAMQELIEAEATEHIGAARYERIEERVTERNGARPRLLATQAGDIELRVPKLRKGSSFFPVILEPRRRIDQALYAVVMEAYVCGVSTRSVDDLVAALGMDSGISKSEVSRICAGLDELVAAFRNRRLDHIEFLYVYLDATYLHVRNAASQVVSMAVVVASGVRADGRGRSSASTSATARTRCFGGPSDQPEEARPGRVKLVVSDQHAGLVAALKRSFQGTAHQRCRVHFARNLLAHVPKSHADMAAAVFRTVFAQPDAGTVAATWDQVRDQLAGRFPKIGPLMDQAKTEVLAFTGFPRPHWSKVWSTNPLERVKQGNQAPRRGSTPQTPPPHGALPMAAGVLHAPRSARRVRRLTPSSCVWSSRRPCDHDRTPPNACSSK